MKKLFCVLAVVLILSLPLCDRAFAFGADDLSAASAALMCVQTGEVLYQKNARERRSMASTTKIMTSLLALEENTPDRVIKVKDSMLNVEGTSMGLLPGDTVTLEGLIYGMLLQSGNDAANVTAISLGGNVENFVKKMNLRAKEIGMNDTNFVTPSGLDDDEHYSTAYDMALLGCEAVKNPEFLSVCSKKSESVSYGNPPYKRTLSNHNRLLRIYDGAVGIKTGFTKKSGRCLVSCAQRNGVMLVAVTLSAPGDWSDHRKMLDYGFSLIKGETVSPDLSKIKIPITGGTKGDVSLKCGNVTLCTEDISNIKTKLYFEHFLYAPVKEGAVVGRVDYILSGKVIASAPITAGESAELKAFEKTESENKNQDGFFKRIINNIKNIFQH